MTERYQLPSLPLNPCMKALPKRYCVYCRDSTDKQEHSCGRQKAIIRVRLQQFLKNQGIDCKIVDVCEGEIHG